MCVRDTSGLKNKKKIYFLLNIKFQIAKGEKKIKFIQLNINAFK